MRILGGSSRATSSWNSRGDVSPSTSAQLHADCSASSAIQGSGPISLRFLVRDLRLHSLAPLVDLFSHKATGRSPQHSSKSGSIHRHAEHPQWRTVATGKVWLIGTCLKPMEVGNIAYSWRPWWFRR